MSRKLSKWQKRWMQTTYPSSSVSVTVGLHVVSGITHSYFPMNVRGQTKCGLVPSPPLRWVYPRHLNPATTRPCKSCWLTEEE